MIALKPFIIALLLVITSCSNLLTWHLDKGIHKQAKIDANQSPSAQVDDNEVIVKVDISANMVWSKSINSGLEGNSGYLYPVKNNNNIYTVDTDGLLSAIDLTNGNVNWAIPTNREISSGLSVLNDSICLGTARAKLICHNINQLASNKHTPIITSLSNLTKFSEYPVDTEVDLITELAAPVVGINNLFLLKLDNDDLYLINPDNAEVIWQMEF